MALIFEPQRNEKPGLGESLAKGLGNAIGGLAQGKISQMKQASLEQAYIKSGISPQDASILSMYADHPELQSKLLGQLFQRGGPQGGSGQGGSNPAQGQSSLYQPTRDVQRREQELDIRKQGLDLRKQQISQQREAQFEKQPRFAQIRQRAAIVPEIKREVGTALNALDKTSLTGPGAGRFAWASAEGQRLKAALDNIAIEKYRSSLGSSRGSEALLKLIQNSKANTSMDRKTIKGLLSDIEDDVTRAGYEQEALNFALDKGYSSAKANDLIDNVSKISKRLPDLNDYQDGEFIEENGYYFQKMNDEWVFKGKE